MKPSWTQVGPSYLFIYNSLCYILSSCLKPLATAYEEREDGDNGITQLPITAQAPPPITKVQRRTQTFICKSWSHSF